MTEYAVVQPTVASPDMQAALCLGWAVAELFGRLRRYTPPAFQRVSRTRAPGRLAYSNQELTESQQLVVTARRVAELCTSLQVAPPSLPGFGKLDQQPVPALDAAHLDAIYTILETWSQSTAVQLSGRAPAVGRAMTIGGSLADTYWALADPTDPAFYSGRRAARDLLRSYRVQELQTRMDLVAEVRGQPVHDVVVRSLGAWTWDEAKARWLDQVPSPQTPPPSEMLYNNLARQAQIWHELICGGRTPASFVEYTTRRQAVWLARIASTVIGVIGALGLGIFVYVVVRWALDFVWNPGIRTQVASQFIQAISAAISILSVVGAAIFGFVTRTSTLMRGLITSIEAALLQRAIRQTTIVPWNDQR